jgi:hypothetical protein
MSDVTPSNADKASDEPLDEELDETPETPVEAAEAETTAPEQDSTPELVEPEAVPADTAAVQSAMSEPPLEPEPEPAAEPEHVVVPAAVAAASAVPAQQVYVQPDFPPKKRGNRLIGVLLSLVGAAIFAGVYALVVVLINHLEGGKSFGTADTEFINVFGSAYFTVAVGSFLVLMILLVLLLNRAGWWAHVLGSLILAVAVYFVAIGALLFIGNTLGYSSATLTFAGLAVSPWVIAAAVVAREVSIWTGLGIAARGRRVKVRNVEARAAFDREQEAKKADYAGTVAGV